MKYIALGAGIGCSLTIAATTPNTGVLIGCSMLAWVLIVLTLMIFVSDDRKRRMSDFDRLMHERDMKQRRKTSMLMSGKWSDF